MKERPILFSAPMVRAILSGTKSQTRRIVKGTSSRPLDFLGGGGKDGPDWNDPDAWGYECEDGFVTLARDHRFDDASPYPCPYGVPGDRLWVRENGWQRPERTPKMMREGADTWEPYYFDADGLHGDVECLKAWAFRRRPSIHMPRAHSRILLEVTGVRVERLHAISDADCIAEGAPGGHGAIAGYAYNATPSEHYRHIWEAIGGPGSWQANPWVWVVSFKRLTPAVVTCWGLSDMCAELRPRCKAAGECVLTPPNAKAAA